MNDKTKLEISMYKKVKEELVTRKRNGELDIKIGTVNGIPVIKKIIKKKTNEGPKNQ